MVAPSYETIRSNQHTLEVLTQDYKKVDDAMKKWAKEKNLKTGDCSYIAHNPYGSSSPGCKEYSNEKIAISVAFRPEVNATEIFIWDRSGGKLLTETERSLHAHLASVFGVGAVNERYKK